MHEKFMMNMSPQRREMIKESDGEASKQRERMTGKEHELDHMAKSLQAVMSDLEAEKEREAQIEKEREELIQAHFPKRQLYSESLHTT